jgi:thiol-disulfide isomerase/thioredoxin
MVDFWATWCSPCIAEIPNIRKVYDEKHAEGFEVIAINLDDKRSDLDEFMAENKMPWDILVSNDPTKAGMDTAIAQELSIVAIPFTMLIGRDGNVTAVHVRGKALEEKVQQLLSARP